MLHSNKKWLNPISSWSLWLPPSVMAILLILVAQFHFLTFHTLAELFAIVISFIMFAFAWSTFTFARNTFLMFLACSYFWIGSLDLLHAFVYKGMHLFIEGSGNLSVGIWLVTRYMESFVLLAASFAFVIKLNRYFVFCFFGVLTPFIAVLVLTENFPVVFVEGIGLTKFKIYSEYLICIILIVALIRILRGKQEMTLEEKILIAISIVFTIFAELAFTFYISTYGFSNLVGHICKLFSFWFLYQAIVNSNLKKPFLDLRELANYNRLLFDSSTAGLALCRLDGSLIDLNAAYADIIGRTVDESKQLNYWDITPAKYKTDEQQQLEKLELTGSYGPYEKEYIHSDGHLVPVRLSGMYLEQDGERFIWSSVEDITDIKKSEQALQRALKMEAVGQMAGGIAHDFNNILGVVLGNLSLLKRNFPGDEKSLARIETIEKSTQRAVLLTKKLLGFSRQHSEQVICCNINQLIESMASLIVHSIPNDVNLEFQLADDLWLTDIDAGDFEDVLLNLVINARDAMFQEGEHEENKQCGQLIFQTRNCTLDADYCEHVSGIEAGKYIELAVSDNGSGISKADMDRVFEPFFTTKPQGKGTGLGLSMVFGFIKRSKGDINIYSEPGIGTTFKLYLPQSGGSEATNQAELSDKYTQKSEYLSRGNETILVVDDEQALLDLAQNRLQELGYKVITASNGPLALEYLVENPVVSLLFSDVVMSGGLNGYELAEQAIEIKPELKVLLTSGYTKKVVVQNGQARFNAHLLGKPYTQVELAVMVRKLLDAS